MAALLLAIAAWIGTWGAAPVRAVDGSAFAGRTLRQVAHVSIGGKSVRVRFTNRFGDAPLVVGDSAIAVQSSGAAPVAGTQRRLTFMGLRSITIPPHADVLSDPVSLAVASQSNLLVDLYLPASVSALTEHTLAYEINYAAAGDRAGDDSAYAFAASKQSWYLLDAIEVSGTAARGAIVALGDSITDGAGGKVNANDRWTDFLAARLSSLPQNRQSGILDEGISGNRILLSDPRFGIDALARLDADVLSQSGVRTVMVLLGINDIQQTPHQYDPRRIEQGLQQIAARARANGLHVIGCTITPYGGWFAYEEKGEQVRQAVNDFIRHSGIFDGVADFDAAVRDPREPSRLLPAYDSGDHLHPNAAGHRAMAGAVDIPSLLW
jgi:lysophospholipase L1-like esterase